MKEEFIKGVKWTLKEIKKYLPLEKRGVCNCSANLICYIKKIEAKITTRYSPTKVWKGLQKSPKSKTNMAIYITYKEVENICKKLNININDFNNAFGINTIMIDKKGETILYVCDVERALWRLGFKDLGKNHLWD